MHVNWFQYGIVVDGNNLAVKLEYIPGTVNGAQALDERVTIATGQREYVFDTYLNPDNDDELGGHVRITTNGAVTTDQDVTTVDFERYLDETTGAYLMVADEYLYGHWPLIPQGTETLTFGGIAYYCSKFMVGGNADQGYAWATQYVPVPLKIVRGTWEGNVTAQLTGWG